MTLPDPNTGWIAVKLRLNWEDNLPPPSFSYVFDLNDGSDNNRRALVFDRGSTSVWRLFNFHGGSSEYLEIADSFLKGESRLLWACWTPTNMGLSVDGSPFVYTPRTNTISSMTNFWIGHGAGTYPINADILWVVPGSGLVPDDLPSRIFRTVR